MESVDQVGRRERFMQSNFESLSGIIHHTDSQMTQFRALLIKAVDPDRQFAFPPGSGPGGKNL